MKLQEQRVMLQQDKEKVNKILRGHSKDMRKELEKIIKDSSLGITQAWDTQVAILLKVYAIQEAEENFGSKIRMLDNIYSLKEMEDIYTYLKFICLRFENNVPEEYKSEGIEYIVHKNISGIALFRIIQLETWKQQNNALMLAKALKKRQQLTNATILLYLMSKAYKNNKSILLELADCWMEDNRWKEACETLQRIRKPSREVKEIIKELEKVIADETL